MSREIIISTSMLSSDFSRLAEEAAALQAAGTEWLHWDCMDGHFTVPLTFGPLVLKALRPLSDLYFDAHLMVTNPEAQIPQFVEAGADGISIHLETTDDASRLLKEIRRQGCEAGLVVNPPTPLDDLQPLLEYCDTLMLMGVQPGYSGQAYGEGTDARISTVREMIDREGLAVRIEVDGGVNEATASRVISAGADVLVSASYVFNHPQGYQAALNRLREIAAETPG